ncbi:MAG: phage tail tape measure protein [Sulfurospirillum sp.]|nr:phage tail tape measure protein [Sulfurospirillum sp.]
MSLKTMGVSIVIGSVFSGAKALANSNYALNKLNLSISALNTKKANLKADTKEYKRAEKQIASLSSAISKINKNKIKIDTVIEGREKFKSSIMEKFAIGATIAAPIKVAIDFESSMADVKKVVDFANDVEFKGFESSLLSLSKTIPLSANELAQITASGGQLGIAKDNLMEFTTTVAKMSTAFDMSAGDAGDSIAKLMNVYGLSMSEVKNLGDSINHLSDNSAAKAADVVSTLGRIGGVAKVFGLTSIEAGALSSAFIALGKPPEVAATSINALLLKLKTADKQGAKFQDALQGIGLDATELKKAVDEDAQGALNNFLQTLSKVDKTEQMGVLSDLFGAEYSDDIALLVGGLENYEKALSLTSDATKYQNSMQREFEARSATTANNLKLLGNGVSEIAINFGSVLLPALNGVVSVIRTVSSGFASLINIPVLGDGIKVVLGLAAGLALTSIAISGVGFVAGYAVTGFLALKNAFLVARVGALLLNTAILANPIGLVVGAVVGAGLLLYTFWDPIKEAWGSFFDWVGAKFSFVSSGIEKISSISKSIGGFFGFGGDDKEKKKEEKKPSKVATVLKNSTVAIATAGTLAMATPAVVTPKVNQAVVTPKFENTSKSKTKDSTLSVVVNINNPKVTSKEEIQAMKIDIQKAVEIALKEIRANEKNRTLGDVA